MAQTSWVSLNSSVTVLGQRNTFTLQGRREHLHNAAPLLDLSILNPPARALRAGWGSTSSVTCINFQRTVTASEVPAHSRVTLRNSLINKQHCYRTMFSFFISAFQISRQFFSHCALQRWDLLPNHFMDCEKTLTRKQSSEIF